MLIHVSPMKTNPAYQILKRMTPKIFFLLVKFRTLKENEKITQQKILNW